MCRGGQFLFEMLSGSRRGALIFEGDRGRGLQKGCKRVGGEAIEQDLPLGTVDITLSRPLTGRQQMLQIEGLRFKETVAPLLRFPSSEDEGECSAAARWLYEVGF